MPKDVFKIDAPKSALGCVVADSPHSGTEYPGDFGYAAPLHELKKAEDTAVDFLDDFLPDLGVPFLQAKFPRSYIDPNRADDVTARFLKEDEQEYAGKEAGLVRQKCTPRSTEKVYDRKLKLSEVFNRVAGYHKPYHDKLAEMLDDTHARHGKVVHLNCHSMPSRLDKGRKENLHDVIIGTKGHSTAAPEVAKRLKELFEAKGYKVGMNISGFSGAEIVKRHGDPAKGRHSLQVELNRKLYMDEDTLALKPAEAAKLKNDLKEIVSEFSAWCDALPPPVPPARPSAPRSPALS